MIFGFLKNRKVFRSTFIHWQWEMQSLWNELDYQQLATSFLQHWGCHKYIHNGHVCFANARRFETKGNTEEAFSRKVHDRRSRHDRHLAYTGGGGASILGIDGGWNWPCERVWKMRERRGVLKEGCIEGTVAAAHLQRCWHNITQAN